MIDIHGKYSGIIDNYDWIRSMTEDEKLNFLEIEEKFSKLMTVKSDILEKILYREQDFYQIVP